MGTQSKYNEYKDDYRKKTYKRFTVDLKIDEMNDLDEKLKELGLSKAEFLRLAISKIDDLV